MSFFFLMLETAFKYLFEGPLYQLYVHSPSIWGIGGWSGLSNESICSSITLQPQKYWELNDLNKFYCEELIKTRSNSFVMTAMYLSYIVVVLFAMKYAFFAMLECLSYYLLPCVGSQQLGIIDWSKGTYANRNPSIN